MLFKAAAVASVAEGLQELGDGLHEYLGSLLHTRSVNRQMPRKAVCVHIRLTKCALHQSFPRLHILLSACFPPLLHKRSLQLRPALRFRLPPMLLHMLLPLLLRLKAQVAQSAGHQCLGSKLVKCSSVRLEVGVEVEAVSYGVAADGTGEFLDLLVDGLDVPLATYVCGEGLAAGGVGAGERLYPNPTFAINMLNPAY